MEHVAEATVIFVTSTLKLAVKEGYKGDITADIVKIVREYEPDVVVLSKNNDSAAGDTVGTRAEGVAGAAYTEVIPAATHERGERANKNSRDPALIRQAARFSAGILFFAAGIVLERVFNADEYISAAAIVISYLLFGGDVLLQAAKNITRGKIFDEHFLMSAATIGAFAIGEFHEAAAVMLFYQIGEMFQDMAVRRSKKSITGLMDIRPDYANLVRDGEVVRVSPGAVAVGDIIIVKPGEKIPMDGVVITGESMLDTAALTGESIPRKASASDTVLSGCVNLNGVLTISVTKLFGESTAAKIIDLVENAVAKKAPAEKFITKFAKYYTPAVVGFAALISLIPPLAFGQAWSEWVNRGLIFLVISCPCALVISIPLSYFGGIGGASRNGVLVKGGNYLEALGSLDTVVFDKTGTLTKGVFRVTKMIPADGVSENDLLETAAYAETYSSHPIAVSIRAAHAGDIYPDAVADYKEIPGNGVSAAVKGRRVLAGNASLMSDNGIKRFEVKDAGTKIYVAVDGGYAGCIVISDEIKTGSRDAIIKLRGLGVRRAVMLTGDGQESADAVANALGLDGAYAGLLPAGKVEKLESLEREKASKGKLAFVGDGINDAPVLARADVGVAMGAMGSDAAIEAADVVLMTDEPEKLACAVDIARATKRIVWQNIILALGVKGVFLAMGALGATTMWGAVFADVGVALLAVLNAMRIIRFKPADAEPI
jgi:Cd2+/Zn2+-exporting ATPase